MVFSSSSYHPNANGNVTAGPSTSTSTSSQSLSSSQYPSPSTSTDSLADMSASVAPTSTSASQMMPGGYRFSAFDVGSQGPLACKAEIALEKGGSVINMFGGPRTGVAYSLPGHVVISVPNLPAGAGSVEKGGYGRVRELKSLEIVFEGKSEFFDEAGRYQAMRLIQVRKSLLPESGESHILQHCPQTSKHLFPPSETTYAMAFDLAVPGWLPPSFDNDVSSVSYGVVCFVTVGWAKEGVATGPSAVSSVAGQSAPVAIPNTVSLGSSFPGASGLRTTITRGLSSAMSSFTGTQWSPSSKKSVQSSWQAITVNRHRAYAARNQIMPDGTTSTTPLPPPEHTLRHFTLKPSEDSPSPVECLISVPDTVDVNGSNIRIGVRIRARKGFTIETSDNAQAGARTGAPVPAGTMQAADGAAANEDVDMDQEVAPAAGERGVAEEAGSEAAATNKTQRPLGTIRMVELGMEIEEIERYTSTPAQPFLAAYPVPEDQPNWADPNFGQHALLSPPSRLSEMQALGLSADPSFKGTRSRTLMLGDDGKPRTYKFDNEGLQLGPGWRKVNVIVPLPSQEAQLAGTRRPMSELESPFARIKHKLKIRITCRCSTMPGKDTLVVLTTPLRCGTAPIEPQLDLPYITGQSAHPLADLPISLPAYNQIFHENGNAREDDDPLPIYNAEKDEVPPYTPGRAIAPLPVGPRARLSTPARPAMDLSRDAGSETADTSATSEEAASGQVISPASALSSLFACPSTSASGTLASALTGQGSSYLSPSDTLSTSIWTPSSFLGNIPMPRPSPLGWSHTPDGRDLSPSPSPHPLGSAIGMSMVTGPSDTSMESDLGASGSNLRDVMGPETGQVEMRRVVKPIEVPTVGRNGNGPMTRRSRAGAALQLGVPPVARRRA